ncbi:MAG: tetratricopeptide repeat protein [Calditrichaeota bacterium]|nr:tetratricopeptide repeat protein [Calditrichota bacterium]
MSLLDYSGNKDLFINTPESNNKYYRINPDVAKRYFVNQTTVPTPSFDVFLKQKPKNGYRVFVLGGSSAAGFPYGNNMMFSRILEKDLQKRLTDKKVEVINLAMSAINSITLLDFMDEILEHDPDQILIYAGHNEYYGALGVGSNESIGNKRWIVSAYLSFRNFQTFDFLKDIITKTKNAFLKLFTGSTQKDPNETLMSRIVAEQVIPEGSELFDLGNKQFEENLKEIIVKAQKANVDIILSEVVSNLKGQAPFISLDSESPSADDFYAKAVQFETKEEWAKARESYILAKDKDVLRFRAHTKLNLIINKLGNEFQVPVVPMQKVFEANSPNGLMGHNLFLEHLHPNIKGYFIISNAFLSTMFKSNFSIEDISLKIKNWGISELDSVYGNLSVKSLKAGWPFKKGDLLNTFFDNYKPENEIEQLAFNVLTNPDFNLQTAHLQLASKYEEQGKLNKAFKEYQALINTIPNEISFYNKAATIKLKQKEFLEARSILKESLRYKRGLYALKWIGQIAIMQKQFNQAIRHLTEALKLDSNDEQIIFNLCRSYYFVKDFKNAENTFQRLKKTTTNPEYVSNIERIRERLVGFKN